MLAFSRRRTVVTAGGAPALCGLASVAAAETPVERGEYLVRGPMICCNCHTLQGPNGPDMTKELAGASWSSTKR